MNLFWKRIFGQMQSASKMEAQFAVLTADFKRYTSVEASKELAEYRELFEKVKSPAFKEKKKMLTSRKYKDTQEYRDMQKFTKLDNNRKIARYYETLKNPILAEYLEFRNHPDFIKLGKSSEVKKDPMLQRMKKFERSSEYKNYVRYHNSYVIKEYEELKAKVSTPEFKVANDFWSDARRWERTDEAAIERRYFELANNEDIKFYEKTDGKKFQFLREFELKFNDSFDWNSINASHWESGFNYPGDKLVGNHSFTNEKQANNGGNNVNVSGGELYISTRLDRKSALAWDQKRGFVNQVFEYTSDVINGKKAICQKGGIFKAKISFKGKNLTHAFWLTGTHRLPHVNVAVCNGKTIEVGTHWATKFEKKYNFAKVKGLNVADYHIYTLEWTAKELIWKINNIEVYRTSEGVPTEALFPMFSSFIAASQKGGEGTLQVDWIEVWGKK